ncbi:TPA: hypothetical protein QH450_003645 [Providencia alcalifaciens]|nr:hypothetical protein [Providencia alcalifaciens]
MQILNFLKAHICHSTESALKLARKEIIHGHGHKHLDFAQKLIIAKNESAHTKLIILATKSEHKYQILCEKIDKYHHQEIILERLKFIECLQYIRSDTTV